MHRGCPSAWKASEQWYLPSLWLGTAHGTVTIGELLLPRWLRLFARSTFIAEAKPLLREERCFRCAFQASTSFSRPVKVVRLPELRP